MVLGEGCSICPEDLLTTVEQLGGMSVTGGVGTALWVSGEQSLRPFHRPGSGTAAFTTIAVELTV